MRFSFIILSLFFSTLSLANDLDSQIHAAEKRLAHFEGSVDALKKLELTDENDLSEIQNKIPPIEERMLKLSGRIKSLKRTRDSIRFKRYDRFLAVLESNRSDLASLNSALLNLNSHGGGAIVQYQGNDLGQDLEVLRDTLAKLSRSYNSRIEQGTILRDSSASTSFLLDVDQFRPQEKILIEQARQSLSMLKYQRTEYLRDQYSHLPELDRLNKDRILQLYAEVDEAIGIANFLVSRDKL